MTSRCRVAAKGSPERQRLVARTSLMRPLKRSILPLVWGWRGGMRRCSRCGAWQIRSQRCWPVGSRSPVAPNRSVNSWPLAVKMGVILKAAAWRRWVRKPWAPAADCCGRIST